MYTRPWFTVTAPFFALLAIGACSTSTPIGVVPTGGAGQADPGGGGVATAGTSGAAGGGGVATAGTSGAAGQTTQGPYVPSGAEVLNDQPFTNPSGVSGDWVGYLENYSQYVPGLDVVRLHFAVDASGNQTLSVVRGMGTVPPPPTDPYQAWPAAIIDANGGPGVGEEYPQAPMPGFLYTAHEVTWQGSRLRFVLLSAEPWNTWCTLQTSYPESGDPGAYTCSPGNGYTASDGKCRFTDHPAARCDVNHEAMCDLGRGICGCNATGCGANASTKDPYDITFSGDQALGSAEGYNLILMPATP